MAWSDVSSKLRIWVWAPSEPFAIWPPQLWRVRRETAKEEVGKSSAVMKVRSASAMSRAAMRARAWAEGLSGSVYRAGCPVMASQVRNTAGTAACIPDVDGF